MTDESIEAYYNNYTVVIGGFVFSGVNTHAQKSYAKTR